jgi:hypothetical protein
MLLTNGLVRHIAPSWDHLVIPVKQHNFASCKFMWSDLPNVCPVPRKDTEECIHLADSAEAIGCTVLRNGMHSRNNDFNIEKWDQSFYEQAGVPFNESWDGWKVPECKTCIEPFSEPYAFVHDDPERNCFMNMKAIPHGLRLIRNSVFANKHIFEWTEVLRNAQEIHTMESCFAILVDRLDGIKAKRLVIHAYMRNSRPPVYRKNWEILR